MRSFWEVEDPAGQDFIAGNNTLWYPFFQHNYDFQFASLEQLPENILPQKLSFFKNHQKARQKDQKCQIKNHFSKLKSCLKCQMFIFREIFKLKFNRWLS